MDKHSVTWESLKWISWRKLWCTGLCSRSKWTRHVHWMEDQRLPKRNELIPYRKTKVCTPSYGDRWESEINKHNGKNLCHEVWRVCRSAWRLNYVVAHSAIKARSTWKSCIRKLEGFICGDSMVACCDQLHQFIACNSFQRKPVYVLLF
jgi:hypothetical protein